MGNRESVVKHQHTTGYSIMIFSSWENSLYILDTNPLSDTCFANIFSQSVVYLYTSFVSLKEQKEKFWWSYIYLFVVITHNFDVVSNLCLVKLWFFFFLLFKNFFGHTAWHVGSNFLTGDWPTLLALVAWSLNHWITKEVWCFKSFIVSHLS